LVVVGVGWHPGQLVHQGIDALRLRRVRAAQRRPCLSGKPVGGLGLAAGAQGTQRSDEHAREQLELIAIVIGRTSCHTPIVFTLSM
jgi:hypothetical protein